MSSFASHHTEPLLQSTLSAPRGSTSSSPSSEACVASSAQTEKLHSLLTAFKPLISPALVRDTIDILLYDGTGFSSDFDLDEEGKALRKAAVGAIVASIYGHILDTCLQQATEAENEANWWTELEQSSQKIAWYLLETLPLRMKRVLNTIINTLRARDLAITPRAFTPHSLRQLFPSSSRPTQLAISFFPHLFHHSRMISHSPFELARQECRSRRQALQDIRDDRAERLGRLAASRPTSLLNAQELTTFFGLLQWAVDDSVPSATDGEESLVASLWELYVNKLPQMSSLHGVGLAALRRPSRLTRLWPRLLIIPPITVILFRLAYGSRKNLAEYLTQAVETVTGFWRGYLVQPFRDILDTVRTGGEEGARIVSREGVRADMESLERMALALSKDKFNFSPAELGDLSIQIRRGDLTPVLKVYEEDLKSPLRSAVTGSLIRSLLIQVQKMKVDVDVALSGIDKLLKSQELTFAFVGVAPALAIVYASFSWLRNVWKDGLGKGVYGGKRRREAVWLSIRRIERLLVLSSSGREPQSTQSVPLTSLEQGLILLSVAQLRAYAETYLPPRSRLREEFLIDVSDLEDPNIGRMDKRDIVNRMWKSWGNILGWSSIGGK